MVEINYLVFGGLEIYIHVFYDCHSCLGVVTDHGHNTLFTIEHSPYVYLAQN
jgi:hypothetical protein